MINIFNDYADGISVNVLEGVINERLVHTIILTAFNPRTCDCIKLDSLVFFNEGAANAIRQAISMLDNTVLNERAARAEARQ